MRYKERVADSNETLEENLRRRTASLLSQFDGDTDALKGDGRLSPQAITSLDGIAANSIRLLRENKTNAVRADQANPGSFDLDGVLVVIDKAIHEIFGAKASWHRANELAQADAIIDLHVGNHDVTQPPPVPHGDTDLASGLMALAELRKSGALNDAEFETAKARLLQQ